MAYENAAESGWSVLRATRWKPPGAASADADRGATYVFALEQAEQMFRAAATVGPPVRPLLLFYGLSQAGRAIAATADGTLSDWQLKGHGITAVNLTGSLADILIGCDKVGSTGSFTRLSELLNSPLWDKRSRVPLKIFWDSIPENRFARIADDHDRRTPLAVDHRSLYYEHQLASVPVFPFPPEVISAKDGRHALEEYLSAFPTATGYDSYVTNGSDMSAVPAFAPHVDGWGELHMNWLVDQGRICSPDKQTAHISSITRPYLGSSYFFPGISESNQSLHPLMAWWAVLFTLSMLARYEPSQWGSYVNVNQSHVATMLEDLLAAAIHVMPRLIAEAIDQVSGQADWPR
jgi:hypothetical protein